MRVPHLQQVWLTPHLHAIHVIFVIVVDQFAIFTDLSNQTRVLPPGPDECKICNFEHVIRCVCLSRNQNTLVYTLCAHPADPGPPIDIST